MKKLVPLLALVLIFVGCSLDDEPTTTFTYDLVPVDSVAIPDTLVFQEIYTFEITYERPTSCHAFAGFDYQRDGNERIIGVICAVYDNQDCEELVDETAMAELDFKVERNDYYVFKFWQGEDEEGEPIFLTDTIPVALE